MTNSLTFAAMGVLFAVMAGAAEPPPRKVVLLAEPYFVTAAVAGRVSFLGEKENLPAGERLGGRSPGSTLPNAVDANFSGGYLFSRSDQINGLYQHALRFAQDDVKSSTEGERTSFVPPDNVAAVNYVHQWTPSLGAQLTFSYLDTTGYQDPSLSVSYRDFPGERRLQSVGWGIGARLSAPFSDRSQEQGKITTAGLNANASIRHGRWNTRTRFSTSYSFYRPRDEQTPEDDGAEAYGGATTEPVYDETDEWDDEGVPDLPDIEVSYFSREVARTMANLGVNYRFSRSWNLGTSGSVSYAYLESTASHWKSNWTLLSLTARVGGFAAGLGVSLTSTKESQEQLTFPDQWGGLFTLSYEFPILGGPRGLSARSGRSSGGFD